MPPPQAPLSLSPRLTLFPELTQTLTLGAFAQALPASLGFPGGSDDTESAYNAAHLGSIPGLGRSPGGGNGNHSSILEWRIPWMEEPGCSPWGRKESDTTELLTPSLYFLVGPYLGCFILNLFIFWLRWASHCCGFSGCGLQALGTRAVVLVAHGLSCSTASGILPDQGSNQCLSDCEADS